MTKRVQRRRFERGGVTEAVLLRLQEHAGNRLVILILICAACAISAPAAHAMGQNPGVRLLVHIWDGPLPAGGVVVEDPCLQPPSVRSLDDIVVHYDGNADTVWVWVYLYHEREMNVRGVGYGIVHEGVDVVTSGVCAPMVWQDESMGDWAESGSEIIMTWGTAGAPNATLLPLGWFILRRTAKDGFLELFEGYTGKNTGAVDALIPPRTDMYSDFGRVGFGSERGLLAVPDPETIPGSWGGDGRLQPVANPDGSSFNVTPVRTGESLGAGLLVLGAGRFLCERGHG
ncbi:hypothetical protein ACFL6M_05280 [Candidatus Eisenbacteria bacterium]|uniref:Uncharacterized protein n=1 Tax=Eiseniibacteriota bacterium TaxID=2212470 RepID=A0ABV6YKX8_UNCEI